MKKILCIVLTAAIALTAFPLTAAAAPNDARTIVIEKVEGTDVKITKGTPKEYAAKANQKLSDGYTVTTGADSYCHLKLDENSLVKMDQKTKVSVSKTSSNKLSLTVLSGAISAAAETQAKGNKLEVRAGNSALAVRGTDFAIECTMNGNIVIVMFTGGGDVDGNYLPAGQKITVTDAGTGEEKVYSMGDIAVGGDMSSFLLGLVGEHADTLVELGIFTQEEINNLPAVIEETRQQEQLQALLGQGGGQPEQIEPPRQVGGGSSSSSSGSSTPAATPAISVMAVPIESTSGGPSLPDISFGGFSTLEEAFNSAALATDDPRIAASSGNYSICVTINQNVTVNTELAVPYYMTLIITTGKTLKITGGTSVFMVDGGKLVNYGTLEVSDGARMMNYSNFSNSGIVTVSGADTVFYSEEGSYIENHKTFNFSEGTYHFLGGYFENTAASATISFSGVTMLINNPIATFAIGGSPNIKLHNCTITGSSDNTNFSRLVLDYGFTVTGTTLDNFWCEGPPLTPFFDNLYIPATFTWDSSSGWVTPLPAP